MEFLIGLKKIITEELTPAELGNIAAAAEWDEERIIRAYKVAEAQVTPIRNLERFLIKAIKEEWTPPISKGTEDIPEEQYSMEYLRRKCGFDDLHRIKPVYDQPAEQFLTIIYDAMNSDATKYKIGQSYMPADIVKDRLLGLDAFTLEFAIKQFLESSQDNRIISPAYILTILYNANIQDQLRINRSLHQSEGFYE